MSVKQVFNTSAELDYPTVLPTLDLDFANSKTLDPRITFTRSSGGSYTGADGLIKYAGVNEARFDHDPTTGESLGLLVEEQRANLLLRSEEFDDASWVKNATAVTANAATSPSGATTADALVEDTSTGVHNVLGFASCTSGAVYTFSVFVKTLGALRNLRMFIPGGVFGSSGNATFNLTAGNTAGTVGPITSQFVEQWPGGWYRCGLTTNAATATSSGAFTFQLVNGAAGSYTGDGTSGIYLWGAQLEEGSFPTSYIPTTGAAATRAADVVSISGSNFSSWYRQDEGTFFVDAAEPSAFVAYQAYLTLQGASITDEIRIWRLNLTTATFNHILNSATQGAINLVINTIANKIARSYSVAQGIVGSANGGSNVQATLSSTIPVTSLRIGARGNNTFYGNRTYKRIAYYPKRLPNSQLQALTS
jgi:hypothetical protein